MMLMERLARIRDENRELIDRLSRLSDERRGEIEIVDPWDGRLSPAERARVHSRILQATYAGGHPVTRLGLEGAVAERIARGEFFCWTALWQGEPVGTSAIDLQGGLAYLVQSGELSPGTPLPGGRPYAGQLRVSCLMFLRVAQLMGRIHQVAGCYAIQGDVQMRAPRRLPDGGMLQGGVRTQHINHECGLRPFLLCTTNDPVSRIMRKL